MTQTRTSTRTFPQPYPAPGALATPTDLTPEQVRPIVDAFALYLKTKNFHWHLSGSHFRAYHLMFDEQADGLIGSTDPLAERVRRLGGSTLRSVSGLQTVTDNNEDDVAPLDMLTQLMNDNRALAAHQRAAHEVCDQNRDYATAGLLETIIDATERRTWFLFEAVRGAENTR